MLLFYQVLFVLFFDVILNEDLLLRTTVLVDVRK